MKHILPILFFFFLSQSGGAQTFEKIYHNDHDNFIQFHSSNRVDFKLNTGGGLLSWIVGNGTYYLKHNRLTIWVDNHDKTYESTYRVLTDSPIEKGNQVEILTKDENGEIVRYVYLSYVDAKNKNQCLCSKSEGILKTFIPEKPNSNIEIYLLGYNPALLPYLEGRDICYEVLLKGNGIRFIDKRIMILKIDLDEMTNTFIYQIKRYKNWH